MIGDVRPAVIGRLSGVRCVLCATRRTTTRFAEALVLVGLHVGGVVAPFTHADRGARAIEESCQQKIVKVLEASLVAKRHQLLSFLGKSNIGHRVLLAAGTRTIRMLDREADAERPSLGRDLE
ncbi:hypothetical protein [Bradyrhizobium arachidis]|uniref:hypothetical protein n=1 Tax=Bradyrhizobium arachidis TaxID=858423 RepID=UPI00216288E0|nr:hypothetical protein [Bradyrhizobium arachidis]UVO30303.1 hypothetical protein KUF59_06045 [Bradyrhizobium arachidis]